MDSNYKIAIVGSKDAIQGFKALGLTCRYALTPEAALEELTKLAEENHAIIFIIEELAENINQNDLKKLVDGPLPAIIPVPGPKGSTGYGIKQIGKFVEQAVGSDIFGNK